MSPPCIRLRELVFAWPKGPAVLDIPEMTVQAGEQVFMYGPSGSGKSTLLGLIAGVLTPDRGLVEVLGEDLSALSGSRRDAFRAARLGVIFQLFNLLPYLSPLENVLLATRFSAERARAARARGEGASGEAERLLARLGLSGELLHRPSVNLSVGQQQRVAAARALIGSPGLVIADEPTSALDADARNAFISLLREECTAGGAGLIFVSHDQELASGFDRRIDLDAINQAAQETAS